MRTTVARIAAGVAALTLILVFTIVSVSAADVGGSLEAGVEPVSGVILVTIASPDPVRPAAWTKIVASIENRTGVRLVDLAAFLHVDSSGLAIRGGSIAGIRDLKPGATTRVSWKVRSTEPGSYVIVASVGGTTPGQHVLDVESHAVALNVVPKKTD